MSNFVPTPTMLPPIRKPSPPGHTRPGSMPFVCPPVCYVIFSATPLGLGKMIRLVTRRHYNHASIAFSPMPSTFYSFARIRYSVPLAGGFVAESPARFVCRGRLAQIKVCAVPLTETDRRRVEELLRPRLADPDQYRYNSWQMFGGKQLPNWDICSSFVGRCLGVGYQTPGSLEDLLDGMTVYEGPIDGWCDLNQARAAALQNKDVYFERCGTAKCIKLTAAHYRLLASALWQSRQGAQKKNF